MRLVLFDCPTPLRTNFYPMVLSRPIFELRCGMTSLGDKLIARDWCRRCRLFRAAVYGGILSDENQTAGQRSGFAAGH